MSVNRRRTTANEHECPAEAGRLTSPGVSVRHGDHGSVRRVASAAGKVRDLPIQVRLLVGGGGQDELVVGLADRQSRTPRHREPAPASPGCRSRESCRCRGSPRSVLRWMPMTRRSVGGVSYDILHARNPAPERSRHRPGGVGHHEGCHCRNSRRRRDEASLLQPSRQLCAHIRRDAFLLPRALGSMSEEVDEHGSAMLSGQPLHARAGELDQLKGWTGPQRR